MPLTRGPLLLCQTEDLDWLKTSVGVNVAEGRRCLHTPRRLCYETGCNCDIESHGALRTGQVRLAANTGIPAELDWKWIVSILAGLHKSVSVTTTTCGCYCGYSTYQYVPRLAYTRNLESCNEWLLTHFRISYRTRPVCSEVLSSNVLPRERRV